MSEERDPEVEVRKIVLKAFSELDLGGSIAEYDTLRRAIEAGRALGRREGLNRPPYQRDLLDAKDAGAREGYEDAAKIADADWLYPLAHKIRERARGGTR